MTCEILNSFNTHSLSSRLPNQNFVLGFECAMSNDSDRKDECSGRMNSMDGNENVLLDGQLEKMGRFIWTSRKCVLKQDTFTYVSNRKPVSVVLRRSLQKSSILIHITYPLNIIVFPGLVE